MSNSRKLVQALYWLTVLAMVIYVIVAGIALLQGHEIYPHSRLLIGEVAVGIILATIPQLIERWGHFEFPAAELVVYFIFLIMSILLGSGMQFYDIPMWDKYEHLFSATMFAGLGYGIFGALSKKKDLEQTSPFLISLFAFTFGLSVGTCWEFYEFTVDSLFGMNLQRARGLMARAALMDTMGDLVADALGSLLIAVIGYIMIKRNPHKIQAFLFKSTKDEENH